MNHKTKEFLICNWFKLAIFLVLLIGVILMGYYFFIFSPQQNNAKQEAVAENNNLIAGEKASCVTEAQIKAMNQYESSPSCTASYYFTPSADCTDHSTYLVPVYKNYYDTCLETDGLTP